MVGIEPGGEEEDLQGEQEDSQQAQQHQLVVNYHP
jgi:hypothetical protein